MRTLAISDTHGCQLTFLQLLDNIAFSKSDQLYILGDNIDRGPRSKEMLDSIIDLQAKGYQLRCLRGNHEQMMLDARTDWQMSRAWMLNGGTDTMESFSALDFDDIPQQYFDLIDSFFYSLQTEKFLFVHAGLNLTIPNPLEDKKSMLWMRKWEEQPDLSWLSGKIAIHGHTPQTRTAIETRFDNLGKLPILNIDNGCKFNYEGYHHLCCVDLTNMRLHFEPNID